MSTNIFFIVDVFAEEIFGGNQLAVFMNGTEFNESQMLQLAREMNFSESTFIMSDKPIAGKWPVRIFTPAEEIPFAGHPTLGTAYIIQKFLVGKPVDTLKLSMKVGDIPVRIDYGNNDTDTLTMTQLPPQFGEKIPVDIVAGVLQLDSGDFDERFPIETVSTGFPSLMVPLKSLSAVKRARINREKYFAFTEQSEAKSLLLFAPETYSEQNQLNVRLFADYFGVPEDPATGSANGCLAGYLVHHRYFDKPDIDIRVEQGYEINRKSILYLRASEEKNRIVVKVGGKVNLFARSEML